MACFQNLYVNLQDSLPPKPLPWPGFFAVLKLAISPTYRYFWNPEKPVIFDFNHNSEG